jgi:hypothetical protein
MSAVKWEYKVVFVEGWERVSVEGQETHPEEGERNSAFGRRFLNGLGVDGWELTGVQHVMPGRSYFVFKRPLAEGAEPDMSVVKRERRAPAPESEAPTGGAQVVSV